MDELNENETAAGLSIDFIITSTLIAFHYSKEYSWNLKSIKFTVELVLPN